MSLTANSPLGPYKILSPVGAGGMGEVYKALDTRLQREVAIKVMGAEFAADPDRRARFEREARALAALNHPNIVAVYDIGNENGVLYSVSELVLGETLRARLGRPPVSAREAIDIATQIANGMAAAHAAGITHRDLKPENIMINREGQVKILDFGLARQNEPATLAADVENAETGLANTQAGAILGTASYMSPEQARGQAVDYRSDQFSFGLVVYEMVSGAKAFERESAIQTMAAILNEDVPPVTAKIPAPFRWIVERCLSKDPRHRYDSTRDLYQELRNLSSHLSEALTSSSEVLPASEIPVSRPRPRVIYFVAAALTLVLAEALVFAFQLARKPDLLKYRYTPVETAGNPGGAVWAPDGKAFAYAQNTGGKQQMYIRYLDSPTASALGEPSPAAYPLAWTPDSRRIFFLAQDLTQSKQKFVVSSIAAVGGEADSITSIGEIVALPSISPDGKTMAMFRKGEDGLYNLYTSSPVGSPDRKYAPAPFATKAVFNGATVQFSPDGRKILLTLTNQVHENLSWLVPFPAGNGAPRVVLKRVPNTTAGTLSVAWMPDSRHVVLDHNLTAGAPNHISVADTESDALEPLTSGISNEVDARVSPDGRKLLFTSIARDEDIVSAALDGSSVSRLIETSRSESMPAWASNVRRLIYVTDRNGPPEIWVRREDGSDHPLVTPKDFPNIPIRWFTAPTLSPDGNRAIYVALPIGGNPRLWISSLNGGSPIPLTSSDPGTTSEWSGAWSPDGNRFVYLNSADGKPSLMIARTSGQAVPARIADAGGDFIPNWSSDGQWLTLRRDQWILVSPDGKNTKPIGDFATRHLTFSRDSKTLYGINPVPPNGQNLFSIDIATNKLTVIKDLGAENAPYSNWGPGIRFSLSPDGKSMVYGVRSPRTQSSLWMLEGFARPSFLETLRLR
jgi:serine/threonine protein kinase/Tol biopolymer transport system component